MVANYKTLIIELKKKLKSFDIKDDDILLIIKNLNVNKAHGWYQLSIRMIKACGNSKSFKACGNSKSLSHWSLCLNLW